MNANLDIIEISTEKPRLSFFGVGLALFIALLYTMLYTVILSNAENLMLFKAFGGTMLSTIVKVVLLFGSWYVIVHLCYQLNGWVTLGIHILAGGIYVITWYYSYLLVFDLLFDIEYLRGGGFIQNKIWVMVSAYFEYAITFSVIHIIESVKKLRQREQQAAELRELSNQQQIANLKAQLNPHFLFNTLNSINAMVSKDVEQTRGMIAKLSEMLRYSLESFEKERVTLGKEIGFVEKYLQFEKHRCGDRLEYSINIDKELSLLEIAPMTIQPIVENAVKHGILPAEEGGIVTVNASQNEDTMKVEIIDTGQGIGDPQKLKDSNGIGLRNTDKRLQKRYGKGAALQFEDVDPSGTKVWFSIPLNT